MEKFNEYVATVLPAQVNIAIQETTANSNEETTTNNLETTTNDLETTTISNGAKINSSVGEKSVVTALPTALPTASTPTDETSAGATESVTEAAENVTNQTELELFAGTALETGTETAASTPNLTTAAVTAEVNDDTDKVQDDDTDDYETTSQEVNNLDQTSEAAIKTSEVTTETSEVTTKTAEVSIETVEALTEKSEAATETVDSTTIDSVPDKTILETVSLQAADITENEIDTDTKVGGGPGVLKVVQGPQETTEQEEDTTFSTVELLNEEVTEGMVPLGGEGVEGVETTTEMEELDTTMEGVKEVDTTTVGADTTTTDELVLSSDLGRLTTPAGEDSTWIPGDQPTISPAHHPTHTTLNEHTDHEVQDDDITDYDTDYKEVNILDKTTTGAPLVEVTTVQEDESTDEDVTLSSAILLEHEPVVGEIEPVVAETEEEQEKEDKDDTSTEREFSETTTGSPSVESSEALGGFEIEPVVAEEDTGVESNENIVEMKTETVTAKEFADTTTGSPAVMETEEEETFAIEPVVAEEDNEFEFTTILSPPSVEQQEVLAVVAEEEEVEFDETTTGSPTENKHTLIEVNDVPFEAEAVVAELDDANIEFDQTTTGIPVASVGEILIKAGEVETETAAATMATAAASTIANDSTGPVTEAVYDDDTEDENLETAPEFTTIRVVVASHISETTSRKVVTVAEFIAKFTTAEDSVDTKTTTELSVETKAATEDSVDVTTTADDSVVSTTTPVTVNATPEKSYNLSVTIVEKTAAPTTVPPQEISTSRAADTTTLKQIKNSNIVTVSALFFQPFFCI